MNLPMISNYRRNCLKLLIVYGILGSGNKRRHRKMVGPVMKKLKEIAAQLTRPEVTPFC